MSEPSLFGELPPPPARCALAYGGEVPRHRNARTTERAAAERITPIAGKLRAKVLVWVREAGADGLTAKEASRMHAKEVGCDPNDSTCRNSIAPRLTELAQGGMVRDGGIRREACIAWVETEREGDGADTERATT